MAEGSESIAVGARTRAWIAVWVGLGIVTLLAIHRLRDFPYALSWSAAWDGIRPVLGETVWAAVKVWLVWGWSALVIGGFALRLDPDLDQFDALLVGAGGVWVLAYLVANLIGPLGLFNAPTIWGLLILGTALLWRNPPPLKFRAPSSGQKLAALAVVLLGVSYLPLQLGSPVAPFMDVLSYPSSAQRIVTFGIYDPFNNDPYGCWGPYAQTPALELFYAMLALGSHTYRAALAETAAMMPMAALMIFATWRLGKELFDDAAGGISSFFLFSTCLFRRAQGMRGTAVDFALVGLALAFFLSRRSRLLFASGALMLGTAIASHAIDGAFAMIVAGFALVLFLAEGDYRRFFGGVLALAGAMMIAIPEFLIALKRPLAFPIVPAVQLVGVAAIFVAARSIPAIPRLTRRWLLRALNVALLALFVLAALYRHAFEPYSLYQEIADNLPMLTLFCFGGLIAAIALAWTDPAPRYVGLVGVALILGIAGEYLDPVMRALSHDPTTGMMSSDIGIKLWDYWCPYFLTLPAGLLVGLAYQRWSRPAVLFALLTILIYPWHQIKDPVDFDSVEHSITEQWAFNLHTATLGYWSGHTDRRWTFTPSEMELIKVLDNETATGRINFATHVLHLCEDISSWSMVQFSVLTGINDDPIEYKHDPNNLWEGGSRVRGLNELDSALAAKPPYILEQAESPPGLAEPPPGYDKIFDEPPVRLFRRRGLANAPKPVSRMFAWIPGALMLAFAIALTVQATVRKSRALPDKPESVEKRVSIS